MQDEVPTRKVLPVHPMLFLLMYCRIAAAVVESFRAVITLDGENATAFPQRQPFGLIQALKNSSVCEKEY